MPRIDIRGEICSDTNKRIYDYYKMESTCPNDVKTVIEAAAPGETLDIHINSPGGEIFSGSEIYTAIREAGKNKDVRIHIDGLAASAASIIAMAGHCEMSPTAMMMVHCVSTYAGGNHKDMEKTAETLRVADESLCTAYMAKAGMSKEDALNMMENTTWLSAEKALELGLIDSIMFKDTTPVYTNSFFGMSLTQEQIDKAKAALDGGQPITDEKKPDDNMAARFRFNQRKLQLSMRKENL